MTRWLCSRLQDAARAGLLMAVVAVAACAGPARAQLEARTKVTTTLDGQPVDLRPVVQDINAYLVPLDRAVAALTAGHATVSRDGRDYVIKADTGAVIRWHPLVHGQAVAEVATTDASGARHARTVALDDFPYQPKVAGQPPRTMVAIDALAELLGITLNEDEHGFALFRPEYWCRRVGITRASAIQGRTVKNLALTPEMGISPPSRVLLLWVRPPSRSWVQVYKFSDGAPKPMLATNARGLAVEHPHDGDTPAAWLAGPAAPTQVETEFTDWRRNEYGPYAAILTREKVEGDVVAAINAGKVADDAWSIVGLRQRVGRPAIDYALYRVRTADDPKTIVAKVAARYRMPVRILRALSGLHAGEVPRPGARLVYIQSLDEMAIASLTPNDYILGGMYEVRPGDTVASLAKRCGVSPASFLAANSAVNADEGVHPGDLVYLVHPKDRPKPATTPAVSFTPQVGTAQVRSGVSIPLRLTSSPGSPPTGVTVPAGATVSISGRASNGAALVTFAGGSGYAAPEQLQRLRVEPPTRLPDYSDTRYALNAPAVVQEAFRWLHVPRYQMGGTDIAHQIDCSHFVETVFRRAGQPVPEPPVHNQEQYGVIVHCKEGDAERGDRVLTFPATTSFDALKPGDRIIFQTRPEDVGGSGSHHTAIYVGRYGTMQHAIIHCNASARTVSVNDLYETGFLWRIYRFAVRGMERGAVAGCPAAGAGARRRAIAKPPAMPAAHGRPPAPRR